MATDAMNTPRSRRGLLAAGLGAAAAALAAAATKVAPVSAADGYHVVIGADNEGEVATRLITETDVAFVGRSTEGRGLTGNSTNNQGVYGESTTKAGVAGTSDSGPGVNGTSTSSQGVLGTSVSGPGLEGSGAVGVQVSSEDGYALYSTQGRLRFDGISGLAVIEAGKTEVRVQVDVDVNDNTICLLTPQANNGGLALWYSRAADTNEIVIKMGASRPQNTRVAYLVLEHAGN